MKPEYLDGKVALIPSIDSMVGGTTTENKQKYLEIAQLLLSLVDQSTGQPLYDPRKIIEAGRGLIDEIIDIDKLGEKTPITKSADAIMNEMDATAGVEGAPMQMQTEDAGYIPAEQRSGKATLLPSSPNS